ncbi:MAG TPA: caspase family protein [Polyangia bacterium]|nr:caspase family protein [Polyangia bacterium]
MRAAGFATVATFAALVASPAAAAGAPSEAPHPEAARFAIIVGVNASLTGDAPLRYADDDAAAYLELFRALGARTYLLSRFDDGTRRLHPQAAAETQDPRRNELAHVVDQVAADVARARARQVPTVVYFVYAGHGNVENGRGYLTLEDARLYGADLEQLIVDRVGGTETHFIVDACYSVFLAMSRGPGGERSDAQGFSTLGGLGSHPGVGLLLSTSSARESHEWSEFQAGVFSHEVRSGLLGAADANGDGQVSYREIAAFVERANAPIPNERFRPDVYAKGPSPASALLDLRPALGRRLELTGANPGRYFIEDARGVRLADFNNAPGQALRMIRPVASSPLYLRKLAANADADVEYLMDAAPDVLRLDDMHPRPSTAQARGAANESFRLLFSLPFSQEEVDTFVDRSPPPAELAAAANPPDLSLRRPVAIGLIGVGGVAGAGAIWALGSALEAQHSSSANQQYIYQQNQVIQRRNEQARILGAVSGIAVTAGVLLLLSPRLTGEPAPVTVGFSPRPEGGGGVDLFGHF